MDELPRDARAFLDQARDVHDPPNRHAARERVRARLMAALVLPAAVQAGASTAEASAAARTFKAWFASSKLLLATAVMVLTSAGYLTLGQSRTKVSQTEVASAPALTATAAPTALQPASQAGSTLASPSLTSLLRSRAQPRAATQPSPPALSRRQSAVTPRVARTPLPDTSLAAETQLLTRASALLARGEHAAALTSIAQHRRRFGATSQLAQEREGLQLLAGCLSRAPTARAEAQRYITRMPHSVLVLRLELACEL